jgi:hypothetical protein
MPPPSPPNAEGRTVAVASLIDEHRLARVPAKSRFTQDEVIEALQRWTAIYGEPPRGIDWDPSRARRLGQRWRVDRYRTDRWPTLPIVQRQFGTWSAALSAAGLRPRRGPVRPRPSSLSNADILHAIRTWTARYGEPPAWADWSPARARRYGQEWRAKRYLSGDWPSANTVVRRYGTFGAAIRAAGLTPRPRGHHTRSATSLPADTRLALTERFAEDVLGSGPSLLAMRVRAVATARAARDAAALRSALIELASASLAWADAIERDAVSTQPLVDDAGCAA